MQLSQTFTPVVYAVRDHPRFNKRTVQRTDCFTNVCIKTFVHSGGSKRKACVCENGLPATSRPQTKRFKLAQHSCSARPSRRAHDMQPSFPVPRSGRFEPPLEKGVQDCEISGTWQLQVPCHQHWSNHVRIHTPNTHTQQLHLHTLNSCKQGIWIMCIGIGCVGVRCGCVKLALVMCSVAMV